MKYYNYSKLSPIFASETISKNNQQKQPAKDAATNFLFFRRRSMRVGVVHTTWLPLYKGKSDRSQLVNQLLSGELYEVIKEEEKWFYIRMLHDETEGWLEQRHFKPAEWAGESPVVYQEVVQSLFNLMEKEGDWSPVMVLAGSPLHNYDARLRQFSIGDEYWTLKNSNVATAVTNQRMLITQNAVKFYNTPYCWGGRSLYGMDDTGLVQMAFRLSGLAIGRDLEKQMMVGEMLSFPEEASPGDLFFFGDEAKISHVGILWETGRILHASARVRIDKVDHHGIYNEDSRRYTHQLKLIKSISTLVNTSATE